MHKQLIKDIETIKMLIEINKETIHRCDNLIETKLRNLQNEKENKNKLIKTLYMINGIKENSKILIEELTEKLQITEEEEKGRKDV